MVVNENRSMRLPANDPCAGVPIVNVVGGGEFEVVHRDDVLEPFLDLSHISGGQCDPGPGWSLPRDRTLPPEVVLG